MASVNEKDNWKCQRDCWEQILWYL